jgi:hypothetical protein
MRDPSLRLEAAVNRVFTPDADNSSSHCRLSAAPPQIRPDRRKIGASPGEPIRPRVALAMSR